MHILRKKLFATALRAARAWAVALGVVATVSTIHPAQAADWKALDTGLNNGVDALAVIGGELYAGGSFSNSVARWNGTTWISLPGLSGSVGALASIGTDIYAGGYFSGGSVAVWNGSSWSVIAGSTGSRVNALAVIGTDLYVGAYNWTGTGVVEPPIPLAKWNGTSWSTPGGGLLDGTIRALAVIGSDLYAAGDFSIGFSSGHHVAKWDGSTWTALGSGTNDTVYALAVMGGNLYAAGSFTQAGGVSANGIAKWDGSSWSALGSGANNGVGGPGLALAVIGTDLYVGGNLWRAGGVLVNRVAKWNGSTWSPLGDGMDAIVRVLSAVGTEVHAGGDFTIAGGVTVNHVTKWTGSPGVCGDGVLYSTEEECDDGNLDNGDGCGADCIAECDGGLTGTWEGSASRVLRITDESGVLGGSSLGIVEPLGSARALTGSRSGRFVDVTGWVTLSLYRRGCDTLDEIQGGTIVSSAWTRVATTVCGDGALEAGEACDDGNFDMMQGCGDGALNVCSDSCSVLSTSGICDDGNQVNGDGCDENCTPTACGNEILTAGEICDDGNLVNDDGCNSNCRTIECGDGIVSSGSFAVCDDERCDDTCDAAWSYPFGARLEPAVMFNAALLDGEDFYFVGYFGGGGPLNDVAHWRNGVWSPLAEGLGLEDWEVDAIAKDGTGLVAGGEFDRIGGTGAPAGCIARWDGEAWSTMGGGVGTGPLTCRVDDLLVSGSDVYVAGFFASAGGVPANNIARWDGSSWHALGSGTDQSVDAIAQIGSDIYVGGGFATAGGIPANYVARWNGSAWSAVGSGPPAGVADLVADGSDLYAVGSGFVAKWDGVAWTTLATLDNVESNGTVSAAAMMGGDLLVGGRFSMDHIHNIARWDGSTWSALGSGVSAPPSYRHVIGLTVNGDELVVVGEFKTAGGAASPNLAVWRSTTCGEKCDDGNVANGDGCDSNCSVTACGNGIPTAGEVCDDGDLVEGDGCDTNCTTTACGNGIRSAGESCDDGDFIAADGCESDCRLTPVSATVGTGGTVNTPTASAEFPVQTAVTLPGGGTASISETTGTGAALAGFSVVGTVLDIIAPSGTDVAPLIITLTVHASAIPPGQNAQTLEVTRNGFLIADCIDASGRADPDPCMDDRAEVGGNVELRVLSVHASEWSAVAGGLTKDEQKCANGVAKSAVGVARTLVKSGEKCLKGAEGDTEMDLDDCVATEAGASANKSMQKTEKAAARCTQGVPFGYVDATTANLAAQGTGFGLLTSVLDADMNATLADSPTGADCRAAVLKAVAKVFAGKAALFLACEKSGLVGAPTPFISAVDLESCFEAIEADVDGKVGASVGKLSDAIDDKCSPASLIPGDCSDASDPVVCFDRKIDCEICHLFNGVAELGKSCDLHDDDLVNGSCL